MNDKQGQQDDEAAALALFHELAERWNWVGVILTRNDVEWEWQQQSSVGDTDNTSEPLDDTLWETFAASDMWKTGVREAMRSAGWEQVYDMVRYELNSQRDR
jgi:hypothetical protein